MVPKKQSSAHDKFLGFKKENHNLRRYFLRNRADRFLPTKIAGGDRQGLAANCERYELVAGFLRNRTKTQMSLPRDFICPENYKTLGRVENFLSY